MQRSPKNVTAKSVETEPSKGSNNDDDEGTLTNTQQEIMI